MNFRAVSFASISSVVALLATSVTLSGCGGAVHNPAAQPAPFLLPAVSLTISPTSVLPGQSATLTWSAGSAASCFAQGAWSGSTQMSGSMNVSLSSVAPQTYSLECTSASGQAARSSVTLSLSPAVGVCGANHAVVTASGRRVVKRLAPNSGHS